MDLHAQYQQQQQQQLQSQQTYDASSQSYDQSTQQAYYYAGYQQQQYPYNNYTPDYANPNYQQQLQSSQQEPTSIHPPGVPIPSVPTHLVPPEQTHQLNSYHPIPQETAHLYYPQQLQVADPYAGNVDPSQQWQQQPSYGGYGAAPPPQIAQIPYNGAGSTRGSRPFRGAIRGHSRGRGRGRGRGGIGAPNSEGQPTFPAPARPPATMAWCELCRVDCNTHEILEQHKNGKKHKKNLKVQEDLQKLNKILVGAPNDQIPNPEENKVETDQQNEGEQTEEGTGNLGQDNLGAWGHGSKRKMRGGRGGGKLMRTHDGSRIQVPSKPKEVVPLICELCNVKCETPTVFNSHLAGKKHVANFKRFQGEQEAALQVLYPALQALLPSLQALIQPNNGNNASTSFPPQFHQQQGVHGPSQSFIDPGSSSVFSQGQSSSAVPSVLETSVPNLGAHVTGDTSAVGVDPTVNGADQFSLGTKIGEAAGIPDSETASSVEVAASETESKMEQPVTENKEPVE